MRVDEYIQDYSGRDMKNWIIFQEEDKWTVTLDIRDLGGHMDTTFWCWSGTLASRVRPVIQR